MRNISKRLPRWLNVLLILTMLVSMLPPTAPALALSSENNSANRNRIDTLFSGTLNEEDHFAEVLSKGQNNWSQLQTARTGKEVQRKLLPPYQLEDTTISQERRVNTIPLFSTIPGYALQETITVPVNGTSTTSATSLDSGITYKFRASGTFVIGGPGYGDAEYAFNASNGAVQDNCDNGHPLGILISGNKPFWGNFDATHIYTIDYVGQGTNISLGYDDCGYQDNSGSLTVEIFRSSVTLPSDSQHTPEPPFNNPCCETHAEVGQPINTLTGNYNYQTTDLSLPSIGLPLQFERTYNSMQITGTAVYSRPLGYGWTHNYDISLTLPDDPGGEPGMAILKAPHGSRLRFTEVSPGTYEPYPGVWATMVRQGTAAPYTYVITTANQTRYTFGMLTNTVTVSPIQASPALSLTLTPHYSIAAAPGTVLTVTQRLTNTGTTTDTYTLTPASAGNWLAAQPLTATLAAGTGLTLTTLITAPTTYGRDVVITASLTAASQATPTLKATSLMTLTLRGYRLLSTADPQGNTTGFGYNSSGTLARITDTVSARTLNFGYDSLGRVITLTDQTNRSVIYGYDGNNDLVSMRDSRGFTWTYTYSGTTHLLRQVKDPENKVLEDTSYTLVNGEYKATLQKDGENRTMAQIDYLSSTLRRVTEAGKVITDTYDGRNLLVSQTDALGRVQNYSLDGSFNRTGVTDIRNQTTHYDRTSLGLTTAITNTLGQATTLQYDTGTNNLSAVIEDDGTLTDYTYDSGNNLRQITTVSGTTRLDYNSFGQVISTTNRRGYKTQFGYDQIGNLTVITDAKLQSTRFTYDAQGRVETLTNARSMVTRYQYDAGDNIRFVTENYQTTACPPTECNLTTEFQYDNAGRLVWTIDPANRRTKREYDNGGLLVKIITNYQDGVYNNNAPDEDVTIRYGYDPANGRLQSLFETLAGGPQGERETRLLYDGLSRIDQVIFNYGGGSAQLTTQYAYQDTSLPTTVTVTNPTGQVTRTEYDALGRLTRRIDNYLETGCPATECNLATRYEYDDVGNLKSLYDPANLRTEYQYDPLHRLTGVIENYTGTGTYSGIVDENIKTSYQYDNEGNLLQVTNQPTGRYTTFTYDELNRLNLLNNGLAPMTSDYDYDGVGNLSKITKPDGKIINYQYDLINRLTTIDYPSPDADVTLGYDALGRRTSMSDGVGGSVYIYDHLDRLIGLTQPAAGGGPSQAVGYGYDARGNRTRLTYPDGKTVTYGYDNADRLTSVSPDWDTGSYSYQYLNHRLITTTNPAGVVTTYNYDTANRLTGLTHLATSPLSSYNYVLDSTGNVRTVTETQAIVLPAGTYQESGGQVVMESENGQRATGLTHQWITATAQSGYTGTAYLQTSLDVDQLYQTSQITSSPRAEYTVQLTTPGTYTVWLRGYPANAAGDSVYVGVKNQVVGVTGFAPGQWTWAKLNLSSGAAATLPLTKTGLITVGLWMREDGLQIDRLLLTTSTTFIPTGFGPAESSRIATQTTLSTTITRTIVYTYDDLYRLTNANYSTGELFAYTYDPAGNRKSQTTLAGTNVYTYDAANRLTQVDGIAYSWDNNGNLTSDGQRTFTYDSADRLTAVTQGATTTQFRYNGDGDRLAQIVAGVTAKYALDPTGLAKVLIASTSGQNQYYLSGLAQYDSSNGWSYFAKDRIRSIRQLVAPNGQVSLAQSYDPFGSVLQQTGSGQSIFGYAGEQVDPTGLVFLRARYYHQALGRFLTADSIIPDPLRSMGWNRYAYAVNNPVRYVDPSGLCGETPLEDDGEHVIGDPCEAGPGGSPPAGGLGGGFGGGKGGAGGSPPSAGGGSGIIDDKGEACPVPEADIRQPWLKPDGSLDYSKMYNGTQVPWKPPATGPKPDEVPPGGFWGNTLWAISKILRIIYMTGDGPDGVGKHP